MAKKDARGGKRSGAGRKADPAGGKTANYNARISAEIFEQLKSEASADGIPVAQLAGQLIREGLKARSRSKNRDPETTALCFLVGELAQLVSSVNLSPRKSSFPWRRNPFVFEAFRMSIDRLLSRIKPPGPQQSIIEQHPELKGTTIWGPLDSAEDRARWAADALLATLMTAKPTEINLPDGLPASVVKMVTNTMYGLADARRDLGYMRRDSKSFDGEEGI
jgi:hypothetical protein